MATNAPQPFAVEVPQDVTKALTQAAQGLSSLYLALANSDPTAQSAEAVIELQRALGEVSRSIGSPAGSPDAPPPPDTSDPMGGMPLDPGMGGAPMDGGGMPPDPVGGMPAGDMGAVPPLDDGPLPPGSSIDDAVGATHDLMLDAAKRPSQ